MITGTNSYGSLKILRARLRIRTWYLLIMKAPHSGCNDTVWLPNGNTWTLTFCLLNGYKAVTFNQTDACKCVSLGTFTLLGKREFCSNWKALKSSLVASKLLPYSYVHMKTTHMSNVCPVAPIIICPPWTFPHFVMTQPNILIYSIGVLYNRLTKRVSYWSGEKKLQGFKIIYM